MFFQESTPDTSGYMIAGYTVAFALMGIYLLSLYLRSRNLQRDLEVLEEVHPGQPPAAGPVRRPARTAKKAVRKKRSARNTN